MANLLQLINTSEEACMIYAAEAVFGKKYILYPYIANAIIRLKTLGLEGFATMAGSLQHLSFFQKAFSFHGYRGPMFIPVPNSANLLLF